jgi:hypothetical protein
MSVEAISNTTLALKARLETALGSGKVLVGPPVDKPDVSAALFLFHILPNGELRNSQRLAGAPPDALPVARDALPLDLRFLVTVFRTTTDSQAADPMELSTLGKIVALLHREPTLTGGILGDQIVRVTPEPYPFEELSHLFGLFPNTTYATSMVYLASPVFVDSGGLPTGGPVVSRRNRFGVFADGPAERLRQEAF